MSRQEVFSLEERQVISAYLEQAERYRHATVFGQALIDISMSLQKMSLQEVEEILRERESDHYLVARDIKEMPDFDAKWPHTGERTYPYYVWIEVNGREPYLRLLEKEALTPQVNMQRLSDTGMLVSRPGTELSRRLKAEEN